MILVPSRWEQVSATWVNLRIIIKLQKRVLAGAATLLVEVKVHKGDPLNEEADVRVEMGHRKESRRSDGMTQLTEQYIDGRYDKLQDQPHGPTQSETDSVNK